MVFNESVNPQTVTNTSITVVAGNPPTTIPGSLKMSRDDFEVVWTPDQDSVMPPNATIVVTITGGASGVTDMVGNTFEDPTVNPPAAQWAFSFETVTEPPPPNNPIAIIVSPFGPIDALIVYGDNTGIGTLSAFDYYTGTIPDYAQEVARENRLPCVYLVDSGGAFLPLGTLGFGAFASASCRSSTMMKVPSR